MKLIFQERLRLFSVSSSGEETEKETQIKFNMTDHLALLVPAFLTAHVPEAKSVQYDALFRKNIMH